MSVERNLPLIRERKQAILTGEADRVAEQTKLQKLTARERMAQLFDEASFVELDVLLGRGVESGVVTGYGLIDGRPVYAWAQDYVAGGGAVGQEHARKVVKVMELAEKTGSPVISMFDSMGARLKEGVDAVDAYARIAAGAARLSGAVPQIALVLGQCAASATLIASMHDIVICSQAARLYVNGPQVVAANTGEKVDAQSLGGAEACLASGIAHLTAQSDGEAVSLARRLITMLPDNNLDDAPLDLIGQEDLNRTAPALNALTESPDAHAVIEAVTDLGSAVELGAAHAPEMITALARLGGRTIGILATQPTIDGGALTAGGMRKAARFAHVCDSFNLPILTLVDSTGFCVAGSSGQAALAGAGAALLGALSEATGARIALVTGKAIAAAYMALAARTAADVVYAWPGSVIAPLDVPAAVQVLMNGKLKGQADAQAKRAELEKDYADNIADGLNAAKRGLVDDVIEPAESRAMLVAALEVLSSKRTVRLPKKHANLPL
jgi:acetyl-CoA carboxylase carboxyltransferase component